MKILLGVIATVAAFYVTSSMLLAQKQLVAGTRLSGYLSYWQNWILERGYSKIYALGALWNKEDLDVRKSRAGPTDLIKLQEQRRKQLEDLKKKLEEGSVFDANELARQVHRFPKDSIANVLESSRIAKQNIVEGKTFISDEEATALGVPFTHKCIELKMGIIDLIDSGATFVTVLLTSPEEFDIKNFSTEIAEVIWKAISVARNIDLLAAPARVISSKSVLALTVQNVMTGKRLTKR